MVTTEDPSLAALYERYGHHVYERCRYLLGDDDGAWDATQDVFMKAERARGGFEGRASWRTWLTRIATHHCLNMLRAQRVRRGRGLVPIEHLDLHLDKAGATCSETVAMVRGLLGLFDTQTQALAVHYYVDEMSQQEVAAAVGLSVPTVRKRLRAFVERAKKALAPDLGRA